MKKIQLAETTLGFWAKHEAHMSFKDKLEIARLLDNLKVDVIETGAIEGGKQDEILVKTIAGAVKNAVVSCPAGRTPEDVARAYAAISSAKKPRLNVILPVSAVNMEYSFQKKPAAMLDYIGQMVACAKAVCADVECTFEDATRAEEEFLFNAVRRAANAGASIISVCDSAGEMLPDEFGAFIKNLYGSVPELHDLTLGVMCSDHMNMAAACAFEAVRAGAELIKTSALDGDAPRLDAMTRILSFRGDKCAACAGVNTTEMQKTVARIEAMNRVVPMETLNGAEAASPALPKAQLEKSADIHAVQRAVRLLGYELTDEDMARVYEAFTSLAIDKTVGARELDAIVANVACQVPPTFKLVSYVVNSGNILTATAHIVLSKDDHNLQGLSTGDGPIDAALMAIEKIIGHHYELDDFQIQSVTSGREAMGEALVKLRDGGRLFSGRGISTDIIGAAIRAYLNALNKIVYGENAI